MQAAGLTLEDYISEAFTKCANIILGSRIYQSEEQKPPRDRRSGRWFLLEIEELAGLTQQLEPWRRDVYAPLIIEVSIQPWDTSAVMPGGSGTQAGTTPAAPGSAGGSSMLLERWTLCFAPSVSSGSSNSRAVMDTAAVYKRLILMIRSLYSYVRVLPAYRMYRASKRHGGELFNTKYTLNTTADPSMQPWPQQHGQQQGAGLSRSPAAAGGRKGGSGGSNGGGHMCQFAFTPVETLGGSFSLHVEYQPATTVHILEQTTIPVSMPRIITDYVDSPYARSAPNAAEAAGKPIARPAAASRLSGPDGPLELLRSSQLHHTPLVRHSWSSRDVSGPTVSQRGFSFSPMGPSSSSSSSAPQQQPHVLLHHRASSQGSGSSALPMSPGGAGGQSPVQGGASSSYGRPPLPHGVSSLHASAQGLAGQGPQGSAAAAGAGFSSSLPSGYSAMLPAGSGSGLPPASPVTPSGSYRSPLFRSSSLSAAAALGASGVAVAGGGSSSGTGPGAGATTLAAAAAGQSQHGSKRLGTSPTLLRSMQQLRQQQQHPRPPVQPLSPQCTQQGFVVKAPEAAAGSSGNSSGTGTAQPDGTQALAAAAGAGEVGGSSSGARHVYQADGTRVSVVQNLNAALLQVADAAGSCQQGTQAGLTQQQQVPSASHATNLAPGAAATAAGSPKPSAAAAAGSSGSTEAEDGSNARPVSAPVAIPGKGKGVRARSVSDLQQLGATEAAAAVLPQQQQQQEEGRGAQDWQQQSAQGAAGHQQAWDSAAGQQVQPGEQPTEGSSATAAAAGSDGHAAALPGVASIKPMGGVAAGLLGQSSTSGFKSSSSSGLLKVHQQHVLQQQQQRQPQQLLQAPSSAPAAPRGMLGQLLSAGSGPTSPAFSPRSSAGPRTSSSRVVTAALAAAAAAAHSSRDGGSPAKHTGAMAAAAAAACGAGGLVEDAGADSDSSSGTSSAADGIISSTPTPRGAIIIRPNPLVGMQHPQAAASALGAAAGGAAGGAGAATSGSPGGSNSSCGSQHNSLGSRVLGRRALAGQGFGGLGYGGYPAGLGAQPGTPTGPHSYLGSSPQLPFAFTPSAASLGTSLLALAEPTHRQLLPPGVMQANLGGSSSSSGQKQLPAPPPRSGNSSSAAAAAATAASAAAGIAAAGAASAAQLPSAAAGDAAAAGVGPDKMSVVAAASGQGSGVGGAAVGAGAAGGLGVGTPSPPLLCTPAGGASGGQVSFIRDISGLATIRRPSWSSRSSSFDIAALGSATLPHHLSVSPGMADLMDPALILGGYSSSHGSSAPGTASLRGVAAGGSSSSATGAGAAGGAAAAAPAASMYRWNLGRQQSGSGNGSGQQQQQLQDMQQGVQSEDQQQLLQQHQQGLGSSGGHDGSGIDAAAGTDGSDAAAAAAAAAAGGWPSGAQAAHEAGGAVTGPSIAASSAAAEEAFGASIGHDESESDLLPFVLDAEPTSGQLLQHPSQAAAGVAAALAPGAAEGAGGIGPAPGFSPAAGAGPVQKDVAVGAFLRMVQEAVAAPVGRLDRRQGLWQLGQAVAQPVAVAGYEGHEVHGGVPVCVGDAVTRVQELTVQLQQLLFPESRA